MAPAFRWVSPVCQTAVPSTHRNPSQTRRVATLKPVICKLSTDDHKVFNQTEWVPAQRHNFVHMSDRLSLLMPRLTAGRLSHSLTLSHLLTVISSPAYVDRECEREGATVHFGVNLNNREPLITSDYTLADVLDLAELAEQRGFGSVWVGAACSPSRGMSRSACCRRSRSGPRGPGSAPRAWSPRLGIRSTWLWSGPRWTS